MLYIYSRILESVIINGWLLLSSIFHVPAEQFEAVKHKKT